jgi:hypothetical protein
VAHPHLIDVSVKRQSNNIPYADGARPPVMDLFARHRKGQKRKMHAVVESHVSKTTKRGAPGKASYVTQFVFDKQRTYWQFCLAPPD